MLVLTWSCRVCSLYYADLERAVLQATDRRDTLLMRMVDDSVLVTRDRATALHFLHTMHHGTGPLHFPA